MKKFIAFLLILIMCFPSVSICAEEDYIKLEPYPYSSHVLGEDLIIYGDTSFKTVSLGLYYPDDEQNYRGKPKLIIPIFDYELRSGYKIETDTLSALWPRGEWKIRIQYGDYKDEITVNMTTEPMYDRYIRIAEYSDNTLTSLVTHTVRGMRLHNNMLEFTTEDGNEIRIFSWDNFAPTDSGSTRLFIATYKDGYMQSAKTYEGVLTDYENHISLDISPRERLELFYWSDSFAPIE